MNKSLRRLAFPFALLIPLGLTGAANTDSVVVRGDWCCDNTGCPGGPDNCITVNPPGGGSITCYKAGIAEC